MKKTSLTKMDKKREKQCPKGCKQNKAAQNKQKKLKNNHYRKTRPTPRQKKYSRAENMKTGKARLKDGSAI